MAVLVVFVAVGVAVLLYFLLRPKYREDPVEPPEPSGSPLKVFSKAAVVSLGEPCSGIGKYVYSKLYSVILVFPPTGFQTRLSKYFTTMYYEIPSKERR